MAQLARLQLSKSQNFNYADGGSKPHHSSRKKMCYTDNPLLKDQSEYIHSSPKNICSGGLMPLYRQPSPQGPKQIYPSEPLGSPRRVEEEEEEATCSSL